MKIVVDIPDEEYESYALAITFGMGSTAIRRILDGKPLPKGHGALKDATTLKKMFEDKEGDDFTAFHFYDAIDDCPTIIEADKEGAEE